MFLKPYPWRIATLILLFTASTRALETPSSMERRIPSRFLDWQHLFGRFRQDQPRLPELDGAHVAERRVDPEVVAPVHVVGQLGLQVAEVDLPDGELGDRVHEEAAELHGGKLGQSRNELALPALAQEVESRLRLRAGGWDKMNPSRRG